MRIAVFQSPTVPACTNIYREEDAKYTSWVRITDWAIVEFQPRDAKSVVPEKLAAIDAEIKEARVRHHGEIAPLERARADLLAITQAKAS